MARNYMTPEETAAVKARLLFIMLRHVGPDKKIGMGELYEQVFDRPYNSRINDTRRLRKLIKDLRSEGQAICSSSSQTNGGYWVAGSTSETNKFCATKKKQALRMLKEVAAIQQVSLPDYLGQLRLEMGAPE